MRKLLLALALTLWPGLALAQNTITMPPPAGVTIMGIQVITTCGVASLTNNSLAYVTMDHTGALCTNASGGGGETNYALETGGNLATIATNTAAAVPCLNATAATTNSYTTGQTNPANCNLNGGVYVQVVPPTVATTLVWGTTAAMTGTSSTQVIAAVASNRIYVTHIDCNNTSASVGTLVTVQDGSGGTTLATLAAGTSYGGQASTAGFGGPLFATTSGNGLFAKDVTTNASVICNASGYSGS